MMSDYPGCDVSDLEKELHLLGIQTSDDAIRAGSGGSTARTDISSTYPNPYEIHLLPAEVRHCNIEGVGMLPCLISQSGNVYEFIRTLRKCIYGKVKHAIRLSLQENGLFVRTMEEVAIKIMSKEIIEEGNLHENPMSELSIQQYLAIPGHPHVLTLHECVHDLDYIYAIMPFCNGGELFSVVETSGAMHEEHCRHWFSQIITGMSYLQDRSICHRDMSLENVLLHGDQAKIIDFGLALVISKDMHGMTCFLPPTGAVGKIFYMAPEIYNNQVPFNGFSSDIWSAGVMLFIMVTGVPPFERPDESDARYQMVANGRLSDMLDSWGMLHISQPVRDLLTQMLREEPSQRLTIEEIASHSWFY